MKRKKAEVGSTKISILLIIICIVIARFSLLKTVQIPNHFTYCWCSVKRRNLRTIRIRPSGEHELPLPGNSVPANLTMAFTQSGAIFMHRSHNGWQRSGEKIMNRVDPISFVRHVVQQARRINNNMTGLAVKWIFLVGQQSENSRSLRGRCYPWLCRYWTLWQAMGSVYFYYLSFWLLRASRMLRPPSTAVFTVDFFLPAMTKLSYVI